MPLSGRDYRLSMRISPRPRGGRREDSLRSLMVNRLRDTTKMVLRISLRQDLATADAAKYQIHCETCDEWFNLGAWAEEIVCPNCQQVYAVEFAVFSAIKEESK